jgi:hypothetical protein
MVAGWHIAATNRAVDHGRARYFLALNPDSRIRPGTLDTLLAVAAFVALILSATGAAGDGDSRRAALGAVLLLAWLAGLAIAAVRRARTLPARADPTRPVS